MQDSKIVPETPEVFNPHPEEITLEDVITAPEDQWRELCDIIDANPASMERARTRRRLKDSGQLEAKPTRRRSRRRSRPSSSKRNWSAASVLHSQQAQAIGGAMVETLDRVNSVDEADLDVVNGGELDGKSRSILVTAGDTTLIMEVVA